MDATTHRTRGFTLTEILIVVLILAIAGALSVPMLGDSRTSALRAAATMLVADLAYAQSASIAHADSPRMLVVDTDGKGYHIALASSPKQAVANPLTHQPYDVRFGHGAARALGAVSIEAGGLGGDGRLAFGSLGQIDQHQPATIVLRDGERSLTVAVDSDTGEASIGSIQ